MPYTLTYLTRGNIAAERLQDTGGNEVAPFSGKPVRNPAVPDTTGPRLAAAPDGPGTIDGTTLTWVFDEALDDSVAVPPARIQWTVSGVQKSATSVEISGRTVTATFATPVSHDDMVFTHYLPQAGDPKLRDLWTPPNETNQFTNKVVTNNTPPAFSSAAVDGASLTMTFDGGLDGSSTPAPDAFHVTAGGTRVDVADGGVSVAGSLVTLALADPVISTDTVKVRYTQPADSPLRDADNAKRPVATFADQDVTNSTAADTTLPQLTSAAANGRTLTITFNEALDGTKIPPQGSFVVTVAGDRRIFDVTAQPRLAVAGRTVTGTLVSPVTHGQPVSVRYTRVNVAGFDHVRDRAGNLAPNFSDEPVTNNTPPGFASAEVVGAGLNITFDGALDLNSVPAADAFRVTVGGTPVDLEDGGVTVIGAAVSLVLAAPVLNTDSDIKVGYTQPAVNPLRDADNAMLPVATFPDQDVTNSTSADTTAPDIDAATRTVDGDVLTITFGDPLDPGHLPPGSSFGLFVGDPIRGIVGTGTAAVDGRTVRVVLASAVAHGETVKVLYNPPDTVTQRLRNRSGQVLEMFENKTVTNVTPPQAMVTGLAFAGAAPWDADENGTGDTYRRDDVIEVAVRFDHRVTVDTSGGTPTLVLRVGANDRAAAYARAEGPAELVFAYTVAADDADTDGVSVPAGTIGLNGGVIDNISGNATLAHDAIAPDAARKVDGALPLLADTRAPEFSSAARHTARQIVITFDEALAPALRLANGAFRVRAGTQTRTLTGSPSVFGTKVTLNTQTDLPASGITVRYIKPSTPGTVDKLRDAAGNEVATFAFQAVSNNVAAPGAPAAVTVAEGGTADSLAVSWTAPSNIGSAPRIAAYDVRWAEAVGTPGGLRWQPGPRVAGTEEKATIAGLKRGTAYRVQVRARTDDGSSGWVPGPVGADGSTWPAPPRVEWARFTSTPSLIGQGSQTKNTYGRTDDIEVTVAFTGDVTWEALGTDTSDIRVHLDVGGVEKEAKLVRGSETSGTARQLRFRYTVEQGDTDTDGAKAVLRNGNIFYLSGSLATLKDAHRDQPANGELGRYDSVLAPNPDHMVRGAAAGQGSLSAPKATDSSIAGNTITLIFDTALRTPTATEKANLNFAFFVKGAMGQAANPNVFRSPREVVVSGTTVTLRLGQPDVTAAPETIRVFYQPGSGNRILRSAVGSNTVAPFDLYLGSGAGGQQGTDTTPPRLVRAAVWASGADAAETVLRLTFDEPLANSVPTASAFSMRTNAIASRRGDVRTRTLQGKDGTTVHIAGPDVTVTLEGGIAQDDSVYVSYVKPDTNPLRDRAATPNDAAALDGERAIVVDATPPALVGGTVSGDGMKIVLYYDEALDEGSAPAGRDFEVRVGTASRTVSDVAVTSALAGSGRTDYEQGYGGTVTLTLAAAAGAGDVTVSYTPGAHPVRDRAGNAAWSFGAQGLDREAASAPGAPVLVAETMEPVVADGALVTLTFNQRLDANSVPDRSAFKFYYHGAATDFTTSPFDTADTHGAAPFAVNAVSIEGARVQLRLNGPPPRCLRDFRMKYLKPAENPLQNLFDEAVAQVGSSPAVWTATSGQRDLGVKGFNRNGLSRDLNPAAFAAGGECVLTALPATAGLTRQVPGQGTGSGTGSSTGTVNGKRVIVGTDGTAGRTTRAPGSAFEVTATAPGGQPRTIAGTGMARMTDGTVAVTLAEAVAAGERVTLSYARAAGDPPLRDAEDKVLGDFSGLALANEAPPAPSVASVAVVSQAGPDGAYTEGERIEAAVTFSAPVRVDTDNGTPTLALIADTGAGGATVRRASWASGSRSKRLVFAYTVTKADGSLRAARVAASGLKLNGGAIAGAADGTPALLAFGSTPGVTGLSVTTEDDGQWTAGDTVAVTLRFAEPVTVAGAPSVGLVFGGAAHRAPYTGGSGSDALTFGYTLADGDGAQNTVEVRRDSLALGSGGAIRSAGGGLAAALSHNGAAIAMMPPPPEPARFVSAAVASNGRGVMLTFSKPILTAGRHNHYTVTVDGAVRATRGAVWDAATVGHATVGLVLAEPVRAGETVTVSYARPEEGHFAVLIDADGAAVADFGPVAVENALTAAAPGPAPLTAAFVGVPAEHDGKTAFTFELRFSENFPGRLPYKVLKDHALQVTNGRAVGVRRAAPGQNQRWTITVRPWSVDDVTVTLPAAGDCAAPGSVCTEAGRKLANTATARILGPALLSVADAEAREGVDEAVEFAVTLNRAASGTVTVDYATADGTAVAGEDYTATSGTLSFAAGEREKTVAVPILDDGHDEGKETFLLRLSNAQGAVIADGEATGTIVNADPIPKAWLARFGRTVTGQVLDAVEARLAAPRLAGARAALAGQALPSRAPGDGDGGDAANDNAAADRASLAEADPGRAEDAMRRWMAFAGADDSAGPGQAANSMTGTGFGAFGSGSLQGTDDRPGLETRGLTQRDLLSGTSFALSAQAGGPGGGFASLWGRGAIASFDGREGDLTLDGEVTTGLLGADWASDPGSGSGAGRWMAGFALGYSTGTGGYVRGGCAPSQDEAQPNCGGKIESTLTGVYPYAGAWLSDRLSVWLTAGYGAGEVTVRPDGRAALKTGLTMTMGAAGMRSDVLKPADGDGLALAVKGDARFTRTASKAVRGSNGTGNLAASEADVWLVRTGIEGSRRFPLGGKEDENAGGAHVTPSFELGLRLDGGDAETGFGADLGGGIAFADPGNGLTLDFKARALFAHEVSVVREWGASGSVAWDPQPSTERGPALSLTQSWGAAPSGGMDALLNRETLAGLVANEDDGGGRFEVVSRLEGEIGYGLPAFGGAFTGTPYVGFGLSNGGARDYRIGWRLTSAVRGDPGFEVSLDATRRESANDTKPEHGIMLRGTIRWW
ncbi:MAG: SwmB domain-containing protein [Acidobacteria bacterium]|nr:SwmB domain-containing protein [Acidobacteriota bacterium]